jgi:hypothetical protein
MKNVVEREEVDMDENIKTYIMMGIIVILGVIAIGAIIYGFR